MPRGFGNGLPEVANRYFVESAIFNGTRLNSEPRIEIVDFGEWSGRALLAEYDASCDTIRVNARIVSRIRARAGDALADRFIDCAVEHERFHRMFPHASESDAHAHVRKIVGTDPLGFEALVSPLRSHTN